MYMNSVGAPCAALRAWLAMCFLLQWIIMALFQQLAAHATRNKRRKLKDCLITLEQSLCVHQKDINQSELHYRNKNIKRKYFLQVCFVWETALSLFTSCNICV